MKKILLILCILVGFGAKGQIVKYSAILGGKVKFTFNYNLDDTKKSVIDIIDKQLSETKYVTYNLQPFYPIDNNMDLFINKEQKENTWLLINALKLNETVFVNSKPASIKCTMYNSGRAYEIILLKED